MNARYSTWPQIETSLTPEQSEVSTHLQSPAILLPMQWPQVITEWEAVYGSPTDLPPTKWFPQSLTSFA
jgi:hypothetical protein